MDAAGGGSGVGVAGLLIIEEGPTVAVAVAVADCKIGDGVDADTDADNVTDLDGRDDLAAESSIDAVAIDSRERTRSRG